MKKNDELIAEAIKLIKSRSVSCAIIKDGGIIHTADGRGVSPLMQVYDSQPDKLKDAVVVDKIIGKAAAIILVSGGAAGAYGLIMSAAGRDYLTRHGITAGYGLRVGRIANRDKTGVCPIEESVMDVDDPREGLAVLRATIEKMSALGN